MTTTCHNLPGITEIRILDAASLLPYIMEKACAGFTVGILEKAAPIRFFGTATCETEQVDDHNGRLETATLKFDCIIKMPVTGVAFLIRQASGQWWLLGTKEQQPQINLEYSTSMPGEKSVTTVTAEMRALKALIGVSV